MKFLAAPAIILLASCSQQEADVAVPGREVFDEFQATMTGGDFDKLAEQLSPEVLTEFRRQLEFTTEHPLEGSWFTGTRDRGPTPEELSAVSDSDFFSVYMKGTAEVIGNPIAERYSGGKLVTMTEGTKGYRHFVLTKDDEYAFPATFSFKQTDEGWRLIEPSVVAAFARQLRVAKGGETNG
ncbi:hypothetical protein [Haloferula sp.]|uniref:hypothetical protein n=1 Tax=Haloferula sp. TaxID=2497595 RepID=UPI00329D8BA6